MARPLGLCRRAVLAEVVLTGSPELQVGCGRITHPVACCIRCRCVLLLLLLQLAWTVSGTTRPVEAYGVAVRAQDDSGGATAASGGTLIETSQPGLLFDEFNGEPIDPNEAFEFTVRIRYAGDPGTSASRFVCYGDLITHRVLDPCWRSPDLVPTSVTVSLWGSLQRTRGRASVSRWSRPRSRARRRWRCCLVVCPASTWPTPSCSSPTAYVLPSESAACVELPRCLAGVGCDMDVRAEVTGLWLMCCSRGSRLTPSRSWRSC